MSATPPDAAPTCYRHPGRETWIRCQRCEKPICPDCMVSAAVGFQCPDCVKQGAKQTRSGLAAYGGRRSTNPQGTAFALIAINAVLWLLLQASEPLRRLMPLLPDGYCRASSGQAYVAERATCAADQGVFYAGVSDGAVWQLVTSVFAHTELWHLLFNMLALFFLGPRVEQIVGRARFLAVYAVAGLAGGVAVMWLSYEHTQTLGASGAIFGLLGALVVLAVKSRGNWQEIALWVVLLSLYSFRPGADISWQGHLGGLAGGALAAAIIAFAPKRNRALLQWTGLGLAAFGMVLLVVFRAASL